jgi:hypothetical protein
MTDLEGKKTMIQGRTYDKNEELKDILTLYENLRRKVFELSE